MFILDIVDKRHFLQVRPAINTFTVNRTYVHLVGLFENQLKALFKSLKPYLCAKIQQNSPVRSITYKCQARLWYSLHHPANSAAEEEVHYG